MLRSTRRGQTADAHSFFANRPQCSNSSFRVVADLLYNLFLRSCSSSSRQDWRSASRGPSVVAVSVLSANPASRRTQDTRRRRLHENSINGQYERWTAAGRSSPSPAGHQSTGREPWHQSVSQSVSAWTVMRCGVGLTDVRTPERREIDSFRRRLR